MHEQQEPGTYGPGAGETVRVFVVSPVRIYREGLIRALAAYPVFSVAGSSETCELALPVVARGVDVVLYDLRCPSGLLGLHLFANAPSVSVVALGVEESVEWVIACAEAGIAGYVTDHSSLDELVSRVADAAHGEFTCPPHIAASLLRRLAGRGPEPADAGLTARELEVAALLQAGLTNRQIAHRLTIQLPTVKNHVHSILRKLGSSTRREAVAALGSIRVRVPYAEALRPHAVVHAWWAPNLAPRKA